MSRATAAAPRVGLGLDAGGTQTRWALATADGQLVAQGQGASISGAQLASEEGHAALAGALAQIAADAGRHGAARGVVAGVTGLGAEHTPALHALLAQAFALPASAVASMSDIELACHAAHEPGQGYVVYAGTGSIAAFIDGSGTMHRAGGRGAVIDDAGGGHWIARQALRQVWRAEDVEPGAWQRSALARALFDTLGGSDWADTRQWVYCATACRRLRRCPMPSLCASASRPPACGCWRQARPSSNSATSTVGAPGCTADPASSRPGPAATATSASRPWSLKAAAAWRCASAAAGSATRRWS